MLQIFVQGIKYSIITLQLHVLYLNKVLFGECRKRTGMLFIMLQKNYPDISITATIFVERPAYIINREIYKVVMCP